MFWVLLHRVTLLTKHWNYITKTIPFSSNTVVLSVSDNEEDHGVARDDDDDELFLLSWLPVLMEFYLLPDRLRDTKLTPRPRLGGRLWDRIGIFQLTIQLFSFSSGNLKTQEPCAGNPMPYHWTIGPSATRMSLKSVLDTATCFILNKNKKTNNTMIWCIHDSNANVHTSQCLSCCSPRHGSCPLCEGGHLAWCPGRFHHIDKHLNKFVQRVNFGAWSSVWSFGQRRWEGLAVSVSLASCDWLMTGISCSACIPFTIWRARLLHSQFLICKNCDAKSKNALYRSYCVRDL